MGQRRPTGYAGWRLTTRTVRRPTRPGKQSTPQQRRPGQHEDRPDGQRPTHSAGRTPLAGREGHGPLASLPARWQPTYFLPRLTSDDDHRSDTGRRQVSQQKRTRSAQLNTRQPSALERRRPGTTAGPEEHGSPPVRHRPRPYARLRSTHGDPPAEPTHEKGPEPRRDACSGPIRIGAPPGTRTPENAPRYARSSVTAVFGAMVPIIAAAWPGVRPSIGASSGTSSSKSLKVGCGGWAPACGWRPSAGSRTLEVGAGPVADLVLDYRSGRYEGASGG